MSEPITSGTNPRIKRLVRLRDRRHRDADGVFVVEGPRLFERATAAGHVPIEIYVEPDHPLAQRDDVIVVDTPVLDKASYRRSSEGLISVFPQFGHDPADLGASHPSLVLVAEAIEKPGNLGAMARIASATGADALISVDGEVDRFNPNVLRASTGAVFDTPVYEATFAEMSALLKAGDLALIATSPDATDTIWDLDLTKPVAIAVGAEDEGHSPSFLERADEIARIPMSGTVDSLNASASLAVVTYEVLRQRRTDGR